MKTAVLIAMFFSGLQPFQHVFIRRGVPFGFQNQSAVRSNKPALILYSINADGTCNPAVAIANPLIVDAEGLVAFCVQKGTSYSMEIK